MTGNNKLLTANDKTGYQYQNNGFTDNGSFGSKEYEYDHNGNMTYDINKKIIQIEYNYQNLPESIILVNGGNFNQIFYQYDALGNKLCQQTTTNGAIVKTTNYFPTFETENGALKRITTAEGEAVPMKKSSFAYHYFIKDHLGSTRVILNQNRNIEQQNSYYPFGMLMAGLPSTGYYTPNRYLYNDKELQDDFGLKWYDYGARFYDAQLGRFHTADPEAEANSSFSPYHFSGNNPMRFIDINGMNFGDYYNINGEYLGTDNIDDKKVYIADRKNADGTFSNAKNLGVTHDEFAISANVVNHEFSGDKTESKWIAHTANNAKDNNAIDYKKQNSTLEDQLTDQNYSTTPTTARTPLSDKDNSSAANNARAAVIDVLSGGTDPTGGAVLWDGSDFLKSGSSHNKFKEYTSINISASHLQTYSSAQKVTISSTFKSAIDGKTKYMGKGTGKYYSLHSTGAQGKSIFWKLGKK